MILLIAEGISVSWGPSPVGMTSTQKSIFHMPSSSQAIRIVSVNCYTLCPLPGGPFGHVNERAIRSGITVVTLSSCTCKGPCPPLYVYRLRFRLCSGTTNLFFSGRTASRTCSCLLPSVPCQVLNSRSISSDCSSFYHFVEPLEIRQPVPGFQIRLHHVHLPAHYLRGMGIVHQLNAPYLLQRRCFLHRWLQIGTDDRTMWQ